MDDGNGVPIDLDRYEGTRVALLFHLNQGVRVTDAITTVAGNLDPAMRQEMVELGLLRVMADDPLGRFEEFNP
jgi:hypothetical protein